MKVLLSAGALDPLSLNDSPSSLSLELDAELAKEAPDDVLNCCDLISLEL